ncbi:MAG TPA: 4Fe-4S binding protein [Deltaproteobacteria bacterium]|jgi:ferredoxin|nr:4Fe-4S binding protein [Deltaproteobacteria bacterium]HOI06617.1 4Fe-4S binding protein [Deltaproteobacteria bacterium]
MPYTITEKCNGCGACARICPADAISGEKKAVHKVDGELCIECGACGRTCPREAVLDHKGRHCTMLKRSQWSKPSFDRKTCMSCNICIDACPVSCIGLAEPVDRKGAHGYPYVRDEKACIGCGFCALSCPVDSITMVFPLPKEAKVSQGEGKSAAG